MTEENDKMNSFPAPREQLRNRLELLEDIRCWLLDRIDGSEETKGDDGLISDFIRKLDALSSEMGTIPAAETPITQALVSMLEAGWLSLGSSAPGAVRPLVEALEVFERENADLKQRILPQFQGLTQRAEHERDALLEQLIKANEAADTMEEFLGAAARHEKQASAIINSVASDIAITTPFRDYSGMSPLDCYEAGLMDGVSALKKQINEAIDAALREGGAPIAKESA